MFYKMFSESSTALTVWLCRLSEGGGDITKPAEQVAETHCKQVGSALKIDYGKL